MGLAEQLDWKLDDATVRVQPGPPLDITVVRSQGHDVIWHEVLYPTKEVRGREEDDCEGDV